LTRPPGEQIMPGTGQEGLGDLVSGSGWRPSCSRCPAAAGRGRRTGSQPHLGAPGAGAAPSAGAPPAAARLSGAGQSLSRDV